VFPLDPHKAVPLLGCHVTVSHLGEAHSDGTARGERQRPRPSALARTRYAIPPRHIRITARDHDSHNALYHDPVETQKSGKGAGDLVIARNEHLTALALCHCQLILSAALPRSRPGVAWSKPGGGGAEMGSVRSAKTVFSRFPLPGRAPGAGRRLLAGHVQPAALEAGFNHGGTELVRIASVCSGSPLSPMPSLCQCAGAVVKGPGARWLRLVVFADSEAILVPMPFK
jgi:hypothetical protein